MIVTLPLLLASRTSGPDDIIINNEKYTKGVSIWMEELTYFQRILSREKILNNPQQTVNKLLNWGFQDTRSDKQFSQLYFCIRAIKIDKWN